MPKAFLAAGGALLALVLGLPTAAWGQETAATPPQGERKAAAQEQPGSPGVQPTRPGTSARNTIPGLENTSHRLGPPGLLREGSFIVRRRGTMVQLPGEEWAFVFHRDPEGESLRPMVLLPNLTLQRMQQSAGEKPAETIFWVTGEIFAYRGVNYLLPTAASVESARPEEPPAPRTPDPEPPSAASSEVQGLIRQLELQRERPRTLDPGMGSRPGGARAGSARGEDPRRDLVPEGRTVVRRKARMVRSGAGEWALVFDAGTGDAPNFDRPMILIPSLLLQQMEGHAMRGGDAVIFEVSGRVLVYQNRNYLIPTLFQVAPPHDLGPRP